MLTALMNSVRFYKHNKKAAICTLLPSEITYSVSQKKIPPYGFVKFFPKWLEIFNQFLHTYYTIISTLEYKFLFKYLQF